MDVPNGRLATRVTVVPPSTIARAEGVTIGLSRAFGPPARTVAAVVPVRPRAIVLGPCTINSRRCITRDIAVVAPVTSVV